MAYPAYVREKARTLRLEKHLSIDEIAERLALPKTTIYYWVRDLPLGRPRRFYRNGNPTLAMKCALRREAARMGGRLEFAELAADPTFRDFVCLYIAEGSKRNRNRVAIGNSDPSMIALCTRWITRFARNQVTFSIQYHADQDLRMITEFLERPARRTAGGDPAAAEVEQRTAWRSPLAVETRSPDRDGR